MAAKCNISSIALSEIQSLIYGIKCQDNSLAIVENYIESLSCPDLPSQICFPQPPCDNLPIIFNCTFNILRSNLEIQGNTLTFTIDDNDFRGGTAPFTYLWDFEEDDFIAAGPVNTNTTVLTLQPKKDLTNLVSRVALTITDANGCTDTKICWVNKGVYKCSTNFQPCSNPINLTVFENIIRCQPPHNLIIS